MLVELKKWSDRQLAANRRTMLGKIDDKRDERQR